MRANRTEPAYFDNSKPDYGINRKFQIGRSDGYSKFDNDVAASKNKFIFNTDTDERVFDNSVVAHMQVSNKQPVIGKPSEVSMFDNSVVKDKQFIILNTDKTTRWFDNSVNVFNGSTKPSIPITGPSTSPAWFDNNNRGAFDFAMGTASKGVFDIFSNISRLSDELYGYDQIVADLDYPELGYNWFDNSVPSYKVVGQSKLIPWGFGKTDYQFSYRFPAYDMGLQVDVIGLEKPNELELQTFATPPLDADVLLDISAETEINKYRLEMQFSKGKKLSRLLGLQGEMTKDRTHFQEMQFATEFTEDGSLELGFGKVQVEGRPLEVQNNVDNILLADPLGLQYSRVRHDSDNIELQGDVLSERVERLQLQSVIKVGKDNPLELQASKVAVDDEPLELQYTRAFKGDSELGVQVNVDELLVTSPLELQWFATPPVPSSDALELQYQKVTEGSDALEVQFDIDRFITDTGLEISWLQSAKLDAPLEIEFESMQEMKVRFQGRVVPLGQTDVLGQARVLPVSYSDLELQADVTVVKEYALEVQNNTVIVTENVLEVQGNVAEVNKDYSVDIQAYNSVDKNFALALQYLLDERVDNQLELQSNASIEMERSLDISADVAELNKWYGLNTQLNVSHITKNNGLEIQGSISHITTKLELGLQLDVLDLVYYMLYEGYNIVPWWSDGKGQWDANVDKNWIKNDEATTAGNGIRQQLDDMGLISPDEFEMFDVKTRNFMYYNKLLDNTVDVKDSIVRLQHTGDKRHLTLGKSKKDTVDTIELKEGKNIVFYDGVEETFDTAIRQHIADKVEHTLVWDPHSNEWELFWEDKPVYFYEKVNGKELAMPYVFVIVAKEDCTIPVLR